MRGVAGLIILPFWKEMYHSGSRESRGRRLPKTDRGTILPSEPGGTMKNRFALALTFLVSTSLLGAGSDSFIGEYHFLLGAGGNTIGEETFHAETRGDTLILAGSSTLSLPSPQTFECRTRVLLPDYRFLDYQLLTALGDSLLASADNREIHFALRGRAAMDKSVPHSGQILAPLDNALTQHLWLLARMLREKGSEGDWLAIIPQPQYAGPLTWKGRSEKRGYLSGKEIAVFKHSLSIAGVLSEMELSEDGELLAFRVPIQGFEIRRDDYSFFIKESSRKLYEGRELEIQGGGPSLGATLTLPEGEGPFPAVVFLHGSGPNDRDETLGPNRIFRDLAEGLADRGIASLRFDKRTWVIARNPAKYDSMIRTMTLQEEVLDDGEAAYRLLLEQPEVDPGHSLGAMAAPRLARSIEEEELPLSGLLLMAPPARNLLELTLDQYRYLHSIGTVTDEMLSEAEALGARLWSGEVGRDETIFFARPDYWDSVLYIKPARDLQAVSAPALLLFGGRDYQVSSTDRKIWEKSLEENPREGTRTLFFENLNHLFLSGEGTPSPEEYGIEGHLGDDFLDALSNFVQDN
jgi:fermentation-respiration switch protein FrsA (DUF1100 family)